MTNTSIYNTHSTCECGLFGQVSEASIKAFLRSKAVNGQRNWDFLRCPKSGLYHGYNKDITTKERYIDEINSGMHLKRMAFAREKSLEQEEKSTPTLAAVIICKKLSFDSEEKAQIALRLCNAKGREEKSVYQCNKVGCTSWHLTKIDLSDRNRYEAVFSTASVAMERVLDESGKPIGIRLSNEKAKILVDNADIITLLNAILEEQLAVEEE